MGKLIDRIIAKLMAYQARKNPGWRGEVGVIIDGKAYISVTFYTAKEEQDQEPDRPNWSKTIDQRITDGEIDPEYFFEGGGK